MELLKQIRVGVVGIPDCGKSTLIKEIVKIVANRDLPIDVLMNEERYSTGKDIYGNNDSRTIKAAKIFLKYKDLEFCFYDCPGHIEYEDQIIQGINSSSVIIKIIDNNRFEESVNYFNNSIFKNITSSIIEVISHSKNLSAVEYNIYDEYNHFKDFVSNLLETIYTSAKKKTISTIDIEDEAKNILKETFKYYNNIGMFFSGGKDSLVGLELLKQCNLLDKVTILFPESGYDFIEVTNQIEKYKKEYNINIIPFCNNKGKEYKNISTFDWMQLKALSNTDIINEYNFDLVLVQYRASDEGVRSKDYHIVKRGNHYRFSPVFYFSESNIWRFINKYNLDVCQLYYKGYRSLGDSFCTEPCMPEYNNIENIISYIDNNPDKLERDGRTKQDKTEKHTMERLRNVGFF